MFNKICLLKKFCSLKFFDSASNFSPILENSGSSFKFEIKVGTQKQQKTLVSHLTGAAADIVFSIETTKKKLSETFLTDFFRFRFRFRDQTPILAPKFLL